MPLILTRKQWSELVGKQVGVKLTNGRRAVGLVVNVGKCGVELRIGDANTHHGETFRKFEEIELEWLR